MRLGEMNNLSAERLNQNMQVRVGWNFGDLSKISVNQASAMLENIDRRLASFKTTSKLHESEKISAYNGMILAKQVLEAHISEAADNPYAVGMAQAMKSTGDKPPLKKSTIKKAHKIAKAVSKNESVTEGRKQSYVIFYNNNEATVSASSTQEAKEKAMVKWKLASTKDIHAYPADGSHSESVNEAYSAVEQAVDDAFERIEDQLLRMAKVMRDDGALSKNVASIGGDPSWMRDAYRSIHKAYDDVEEAHRGALGHIMDDMDESATGVFEDEVGQAESLMAAQDMVDSIQGMLEDVGEMLNEKLPPLVDSLRRSNSADAAASFNSAATDSLNSLMDAVRSARESLSGAVGTLTGEAPTAMGSDADLDLDTSEPADDLSGDMASDEIEIDDFEASDAAVGGDEPLGRAKRA